MASNLTDLLEGPSAAPPPGIISQLDNPPNQKTVTEFLPSISIALATVAVAMRVYSRIFVTQKFGLSDYSILIGFSTFIGFCVMCLLAGQIAPGVHMWDVRLKDLGQYLYYLHVGSILYAPTIFMIKLSILWQYIQVFMPNKQPRALYWTTIAVIAANLASYLVLLVLQIWSCNPMRKSWDPLVTDGHCLNTLALNVGASSVNVVSDTAILLLPQAVIWRLHMPLKQKLAVSMMFFIAILAIAAAAIRLYYTVLLMNSNDTTWYTWLTGVWALVEMDFGVIVACMPALAAFFRSIGNSRWYISFKELTTWRRMTGDGEGGSGYTMENRKGIYGSDASAQDRLQVKSYKLHGFHNMASNIDHESARDLRTDGY